MFPEHECLSNENYITDPLFLFWLWGSSDLSLIFNISDFVILKDCWAVSLNRHEKFCRIYDIIVGLMVILQITNKSEK